MKELKKIINLNTIKNRVLYWFTQHKPIFNKHLMDQKIETSKWQDYSTRVDKIIKGGDNEELMVVYGEDSVVKDNSFKGTILIHPGSKRSVLINNVFYHG